MQNKYEETMRISDLCLVVTLSLKKFPIAYIDKTNPKRAEFYFPNSEELTNFINVYWSGNSVVEPKAFFNQLKTIKSMLYFESS